MKTLFAVFFIGGIFSWPTKGQAQPLEFFREKIEIDVNDSTCTVTGTYYFKNPSASSLNLSILYPVVVNDSLPFFPDYFKVKDISQNINIPFHTSAAAIRFSLSCKPLSITIFKVSYRQRTPSAYMEYILTTTQNWGRPLDKAEYIIRLPSSLSLSKLSLPVSNKKVQDGKIIYYILKSSFLPPENLTLQWERKKL